MAFYRSGFIAADERAKAIQRYIDQAVNPSLDDRKRYLHVLNGCAVVHDVLMGDDFQRKDGTDYYSRLNKLLKGLQKKEKELSEKLGYPYRFSLRTKAGLILKLQEEHITAAGIFGRPSLKAVEKQGDEAAVMKSLASEDQEDVSTDTLDV